MAFRHKDPCAEKADSDEPIFSLRAQDMIAPFIVQQWAADAEKAGSPPEKVAEARRIAEEMLIWQTDNPSRVKVPD